MKPTITAFEASPDRGRGLARDMRVRWALEEVGQPYDVRLVSFAAMKEPAHRVLNLYDVCAPVGEHGASRRYEGELRNLQYPDSFHHLSHVPLELERTAL